VQKFTELSGNERKILIELYKNCRKNRHEITDPLTISHITDISEVTAGSIKNSIRRLINKSFIEKTHSKKGGRGAIAQYRILNNVYQDILISIDNDFYHNQTQTRHKLGTPLYTNPLSSSSNIDINTTKSGDPEKNRFIN